MLFKTNYRAAIRAFNPHYIWIGWVTLIATSLAFLSSSYLFLQLSNLLDAFFSKLAGDEKSVYIVVAFGTVFVGFISFLFFSSVFVKADTFFWKDVVDKLIIKISNALFVVIQVMIYLTGVAAIAWVLQVALISRLTEANSALWAVLLAGILFSPFLLRLWFLPASAALLSGSPNNPWVIITGATHKKTWALALSVACQAVPLVAIMVIGKLLGINLLVDAYLQLLAGGQDLAQAFSNANQYLQEINYLNVVLFIVFSGPLLAVFSNMIVSTIRVLIGVDNGDRPEIHYNAIKAEEFDFKVAPETIKQQTVYNPGGNKIDINNIPEAQASDAVDPFKDLQEAAQAEDLVEQDIFDAVLDSGGQDQENNPQTEDNQSNHFRESQGVLPQPLPPVPAQSVFNPNPQQLKRTSNENTSETKSVAAKPSFDVNKIAEDVQQTVSQGEYPDPASQSTNAVPGDAKGQEIPDLPDLENIPRPQPKENNN
jgi:hypothetical protein